MSGDRIFISIMVALSALSVGLTAFTARHAGDVETERDALIKTAPIAAEVFHDPDHTR